MTDRPLEVAAVAQSVVKTPAGDHTKKRGAFTGTSPSIHHIMLCLVLVLYVSNAS